MQKTKQTRNFNNQLTIEEYIGLAELYEYMTEKNSAPNKKPPRPGAVENQENKPAEERRNDKCKNQTRGKEGGLARF